MLPWDRPQISSKEFKPSPTRRSPPTRPIAVRPHHDPAGIAAAVRPSMTVGRKLIATTVVGTPVATAGKGADTTRRWTREEPMIYGRTSLTRTPVSASTDASTKTCAASSTMQPTVLLA